MKKQKSNRIERQPICKDRVRRIGGKGFSFIPHRFMREGFFSSLSSNERDLYFFLLLVGDRNGISFYHYDRICSILHVPIEVYLKARNGLIDKDLIAFDGSRYQVLSLPANPQEPPNKALKTEEDFESHDPATIHMLIRNSLSENE